MKVCYFLVVAVGTLALLGGCKSDSDSVSMGKMSGKTPLPAKPDADMQEVLTALGDLNPKPIEKSTVAEARVQPGPPQAVMAVMKKNNIAAPTPALTVTNTSVPGPGPSGRVPVRVYTPVGNGPFPVIVYIHGGGWVIASVDAYEPSAKALADQAQAVVVSVDYRMAPENKFPASHEDCYAVYKYVRANATTMKGDPNRVAVAGESAGGNMATAVCLMAKDRGTPLPVYQLLVYPLVDNDLNNESMRKNVAAKPLNTPMVAWFAEKELSGPADASNPYMFPLKATKDQLAGLPPATIIAAEIDPLLTEGKQYADKLEAAGVKVRYKLYAGVTHEFFGMAPVVKDAIDAQKYAVEGLNTAFKK